jgi:hypothetical protein
MAALIIRAISDTNDVVNVVADPTTANMGPIAAAVEGHELRVSLNSSAQLAIRSDTQGTAARVRTLGCIYRRGITP